MNVNPDRTRQVLLLVAGVCTYIAEEIIATQPRAVSARRRAAPIKVRSKRVA